MLKASILPAAILGMALAAVPSSAGEPAPKGKDFPLFMYQVGTSSEEASTVLRNWNILQNYNLDTSDKANAFLEAWAPEGISCEVAIPAIKELNADGKSQSHGWTKSQTTEWIQSIAGNANLSWWELPEARPWIASEMAILNDYTAWTRAADPQRRPTYELIANHRDAAQVSKLLVEDVIGTASYCEEARMPHAWIRYRMQDCCLAGIKLAGLKVGTDYLAGEKLPVAVIFVGKSKEGEMPTPEESYHDFWSSIASGAMGVGVFGYWKALHDSPTLAENLEQLNLAASQIAGPAQLGRVILEGVACPDVGFKILSGPERTVTFTPYNSKESFSYPSLNVLCKKYNSCEYVIAVNSTDQQVVAEINNLPKTASAAAVLFQGKVLDIKNGTMQDTFPKWGVHIYKIH